MLNCSENCNFILRKFLKILRREKVCPLYSTVQCNVQDGGNVQCAVQCSAVKCVQCNNIMFNAVKCAVVQGRMEEFFNAVYNNVH